MKIPLIYPKIPDNEGCPLKDCVVFEKYDGTNLHWVWQGGWQAFGTRRTQFEWTASGIAEFTKQHVAPYNSVGLCGLEEAPVQFMAKHAVLLDQYLTQHDRYATSKVCIFAEFLGDLSFAGSHRVNDPKRLVMIDVSVDDKFLSPEEFLSDFGVFNPARVLYKGKYSGALVEDIKKNKYSVAEGAVCKGMINHTLYRVKIKTDAYLQRLKNTFPSDWESLL